jgi:hypothetical protein
MKTWKERIEEAVKNRGFTDEDRSLVSSWATCAIGERKDVRRYRIDDEESGPTDAILDRYGINFMDAVRRNDIDEAQRYYALIELYVDVV